ncbi:hypothetical protein OSTOST_13439, partial [Ostertagia ostertagi]
MLRISKLAVTSQRPIRIEVTGTQLMNAIEELKEFKSEENGSTAEKHDDEEEDSVAQLLTEAEVKSAQLDSQLNVLQRKISESKDVDESTRIRLNHLLHRLNSSASSIQKVGGGDSAEELIHKQSVASILSFDVTEDDIHHARKKFSSEEAK